LTLFPRSVKGQELPGLWKSLATGIDYREFYLMDPNHLYVARMDRLNPQVTLESAIGQGKLSAGGETASGMASRYDQAINFWGENWGGRNQVVVAINGYFYNTDTGVPLRGQIQSGWYAKRFDDRQSGSGFVWKLDRSAFVGGCVVHRPNKQTVSFLDQDEDLAYDGINIPRGENSFIIYTPQFDATTLTDDEGVEVAVELSRPMMVLSLPEMINGIIREVRSGKGSTPIPFDHVVLSANGRAGEILKKSAVVGEQVGITQEIKHFEPDCQTASMLSWDKSYASIGASFNFLRDGQVQKMDDLGALFHNARTAIAYNDRYIYFVVVDDREQFGNQGMSIVELAFFAKDYLGATWGVAEDGGGSSTMVINGVAVNKSGSVDASGEDIERAVANGMMMVVVLPKEQSNLYHPGDQVITVSTQQSPLRLGPGTNYAILAGVEPGSVGTIQEHRNGFNGVYAKGSYWWRVIFGESIGWIAEENLLPQNSP